MALRLDRGLIAGGAVAALVCAISAPALAVPTGTAALADPAKRHGKALTLKVDDKDGRVKARKRVTFSGKVRAERAGRRVLFQEKTSKSARSWKTLDQTTHDGDYQMKRRIPEGRHLYRTKVRTPSGPLTSSPVRMVGTTPADFTGFVLPDDQLTGPQTVTNAIANAKQSVEIVIYDFGAQDILKALQQAKANLAKNNPTEPVIRVMVNNQWYGPSGAAKHYNYVAKMAQGLGVGNNGKSADGVVQFNYSANNFSLTHQKSILIDTLKPDGTEYTDQSQLPASARAIVATFNLQAYGWTTSDTGCSNNQPCSFAGGTPGTRDFGMIANDQRDIWEIQQVYSSDFNGSSPTQTNTALGLNDPTSNLVWSNGTTGILVPPPTGNGLLYSPTAASYPAASSGSAVASGFYPAPYYKFAAANRSGATAVPPVDIELGQTQGNANAVHLQIIRAAEAAAEAGKPATLYIYNEEYNDDAVLYAIQDAAAAGAKVRIVMTYSSSNGYNYDDLLTTKLTQGGGPVDAAVHLFPNASPQYMYIHAKMIYADLGSDVAFVGSQNFSENSLLFNREAGVQLKESDGTLTDDLQKLLVGTFQDDFALTGAGKTWTYQGATQPCPVVMLTPQATWSSQKATLNAPSNTVNAGCQLPAATAGAVDPDPRLLQSNDATIESWRATQYPKLGASTVGNFIAPLAGVSAEYYPPMPQGPMNISNMVPGPCVLVNQTTGGSAGACPTS